MAETNARKRPIGFVEASTVETDDFLLIDGQTSGTRKIKPDKVGKANTSELNNDAGFQNASEVAAAIAANIDDELETAGKAADAAAVGAALATKVDAASGKGLSTNDYTTAEKTKLAGIATGATRVLIDDDLTDSGKAADAAAVGAALATKVDKEAGKGLVAIDTTLTTAGKAADAKKTGDEITLVKQELKSHFNETIFYPVDGGRTAFLELDTTKNMINTDTSHNNYVVWGRDEDGSRGILHATNGLAATDYIPVDSSHSYYFDGYFYPKYYAFYDIAGNYISGANGGSSDVALTNPFIPPSNARYLRCTYALANVDRVWLSTVDGTHRQESDPTLTDEIVFTPKHISFDSLVNDYTNKIADAKAETTKTIYDIASEENGVNRDIIFPDKTKSIDYRNTWTCENCTSQIVTVYNNITRKNEVCIRFTKDTSHTMLEATCATGGVNINTHPVQLLLHLPEAEASNVSHFNNFTLSIYSGNATTSDTSRRAICVVQYEAAATQGYNADFVRCGWFLLSYHIPSSYNSVGTNFDPTNVTAVGIRVATDSASIARSVDVAGINFVEPMLRPGIITIVDNFNPSVPAMADYAYSKGVRLNLSIIPGFYAGDPDAPECASLSELQRIAGQGHFIFNHTYTHQNFNDLTTKQIADEINKAELWMQQNGFEQGAKCISVPSARFNTDSYNALMRTNAESVFHVWSTHGTYMKKVWYPYYPNGICIDTCMLDTTMGQDMQKAIDIAENAIAKGGIAVIGFHGTYWTLYNSGEKWKAYIDAIAEIQNVYHYGIDEIVNGQFI